MAEDSMCASDYDGPCPLCEEESDRPYLAHGVNEQQRGVDEEDEAESEPKNHQIKADRVVKEIKEEEKIKKDDLVEDEKFGTDDSYLEMLKEKGESCDCIKKSKASINLASSPFLNSVQPLDCCPVNLVMVREDSAGSSVNEKQIPSKTLALPHITSLSPTLTQSPLPLTLPPSIPSVLPIQMQGETRTHATVPTPVADAPYVGKHAYDISPSAEPKTNGPTGQLEVTLKHVYTTRRYTRFSSRPATLLPSSSVHTETSSQPLPSIANTSLLPPAPKKKTRTSYSTDQLEELERVFQDDHYPDAEKRKEIAISVGVTPQRVMVWFQNRRAKWRKTSKTTARKPPVSRTQAPAPVQAPVHSALFKGPVIAPLPPQTGNTLPPYSSLLTPCISPPGCLDMGTACISQRCSGDYIPPPLMQSPPPLRRASLPFFAAYNPPTHTLSVLLDTPEHNEHQLFNMHTETGINYDAVGSSAKYEAVPAGPGNSTQSYLLTSYPQQSSSLLPTQASTLLSSQSTNVLSQQTNALLPQYSHMSYLTPSPYLTPTSSEGIPTSCLPLNPSTSRSLVAYNKGAHAYFQCQALQTYPWASDQYNHSAQIPLLKPQFASQTCESLYSTLGPPQPYITPQKTMCPSLDKSTTPDPMLPSVKTEFEEPGPSQPSRVTEPETIFHCDFSPIHF